MFLSTERVNCAIVGGTLRRWYKMRRWRWRRTFFGHFTKRDMSFFGCTLLPTPKFLLRFSKRPLSSFLATFLPEVVGAAAAFGAFGMMLESEKKALV